MNDQIVTLDLDNAWLDSDEAAARIKELKQKYNITAKFNDGSDHYSSMTYTGTKEDIKKFLEAEYMPYFDEDDMPKEVLQIIRG